MLSVVFGGLGSGKTLFLVGLAARMNKSKRIIANFEIKIPKHKVGKFKLSEFTAGKYNDALILIDEAYIYLEARTAGRAQNRLASYILFQSRKKKLDIVLAVQLFRTIDVRWRAMADVLIRAEGAKRYGYGYTLWNMQNGGCRKISIPLLQAQTLYKFYKTEETITSDGDDIADAFLSPEDEFIRVKSAGELIRMKNPDIETWTLSGVEYQVWLNKIPKRFTRLIWGYLKNSS